MHANAGINVNANMDMNKNGKKNTGVPAAAKTPRAKTKISPNGWTLPLSAWEA
jgi:hypothetical protein